MAKLKFENVYLEYHDKNDYYSALEDVNFEIKEDSGEIEGDESESKSSSDSKST